MLKRLRQIFASVATVLLVPLLLFEEWGWEPLAALAARFARLPLWARLERAIATLPPAGALLVFFVPMVMLLPIKLFALWLLGNDHPTTAVLLLVAAKLVGTAIVARLFQLVEPALMQIALFARWYPRWKAWKDQVLARVHESAPWQALGRIRSGVRRWWHGVRGGRDERSAGPTSGTGGGRENGPTDTP